jgi:flagellar hook protein FlgE
MFQTQFAQTLSSGTRPGNVEGGTNPSQIGLGSALGSIQRIFEQGSIETTGVKSDLAVEGSGFFVLQSASGQQFYTRDGSFSLTSANQLVNADGLLVQGYGVDDEFDIVEGILRPIEVPLGSLVISEATKNVNFDGTLDTDEGVATQNSILWSSPLTAGGAAATTATLLTALDDGASPPVAGGAFLAGDVITVENILKGGSELGAVDFTVTATSTMADFITFMEDAMGIDTSGAFGIGTPGITIAGAPAAAGDPDAGTLIIEGNHGTANAIRINNANFIIARSGSPSPATSPFNFQGSFAGAFGNYDLGVVQVATGAGTSTSFLAFDSLGSTIEMTVRTVLETVTSTGNTWRFFVESIDDTRRDILVGNPGTLRFDTSGNLLAATSTNISIERANTGAVTPLNMDLNFEDITQKAVGDPNLENSVLVMSNQDGFPTGTLNDYSIGFSGIVSGFFSNGLSRDLGQVVLATFANDAGLIARSNSVFTSGPNSGTPLITPPLNLGAGRIVSGALELSNVDLSREFIGLITASTGFSAASRIITTSDELLQELLLISR